MPVKDVDGGLVWRGYSPSVYAKSIKNTQPIKPFYFGGSWSPIYVKTKK